MISNNQNSQSQQSEEKLNLVWLIGALIALLPIGAAIYFLFAWQPDRSEPVTTKIVEPVTQQIPMPEPEVATLESETPQPAKPVKPEIPDAPPLPVLNQSDAEVIEQLSGLDSMGDISNWLNTDEIVRKLMVVADNMADGKVARKYIAIPKPKLPFKVIEKDGREYIDPQSYARYDSYADTFDNLNLAAATQLYSRYLPLFEEAYGELGYPDRDVKERILTAIDKVLATPVILKDIEVARTTVIYKYVDPELEQLPALQKQLLRMGPRNIAIIQRKLRQLKASLPDTPD